ncbi:MAG: hypothetical protein ACREE6_19050, partial [Limisphaerales bacterium]
MKSKRSVQRLPQNQAMGVIGRQRRKLTRADPCPLLQARSQALIALDLALVLSAVWLAAASPVLAAPPPGYYYV